ncbi:CCT2 [Lepeophtheirus salmonis]|uniref:CCT2 n=1 Tax=Lepeophtheirus salmonis TaxID=72036 RepID=A0A7R8H4N4_LEPSM|nr:CCT2 [Lepeophtheirus salmonis]CAF2866038.1 CCT2 [Lepeophtheirus salmonis]
MIKLLLRASLVLLVFHVSFIDSLPQLGSLVRGSSGFLSDIVRSNVDEDSNRGKLAILIAENGGDTDKIKDSLKLRLKSKVPFLLTDEEKAELEKREKEEEPPKTGSMKSEDLSQIMIKTGELLIILGKSSLIKPDNAGDYVEYALSNFNA